MTTLLTNFLGLQRVCARQRLGALYSTGIPKQSAPVRAPPRPFSILEDDDADVDLTEDNDLVNGARPGTPPLHLRRPPEKSTPSEWRAHRQTIKSRFPDGWSPPRKLSRDAMDGVRQLHKLEPEKFTTEILADKFRISPEAVRRILKSKWQPSKEKRDKLAEREKVQRRESLRLSRLKEREETVTLLKESESKPRKDDRLTLR